MGIYDCLSLCLPVCDDEVSPTAARDIADAASHF